MNKFLFGTTERGDAGIDFTWIEKLDSIPAVNLITKNVNDKFIEVLINKYHSYKNIILHVTCTGFGGTKIEPRVPNMFKTHNQVLKLISQGFPADKIVLRVDPIVPTQKGINSALRVLELFKNVGIKRVRYSFLDMYPHVKQRFLENGIQIPYQGFNAPKEMQQNCVDALERYSNIYTFESCAEYTKHRLGCISERDFDILGIPRENVVIKNSHNRHTCSCCANKTELLNNKSQCPHGCLYCYWKQNYIKKLTVKDVKCGSDKKGKVFLTSVTNMNDYEKVDHKLFIVKSCKNPLDYEKKGWLILPQLAPSQDLFFKYVSLKKQNKWDIDAFNNIYVPEFNKQLEINLATKKAIDQIIRSVDLGEDVVLMCYCHDSNTCHRTLVGKHLQKLGVEVVFN